MVVFIGDGGELFHPFRGVPASGKSWREGRKWKWKVGNLRSLATFTFTFHPLGACNR